MKKQLIRKRPVALTASAMAISISLLGCSKSPETEKVEAAPAPEASTTLESQVQTADVHPEIWPTVVTPALDPAVEARIDEILAIMTLEQKVGQVIQADSSSVTPEEVKKYRLGSILSGGNSAPGPLQYADTATWLEAADEYFEASIDPEGVEIAIPLIWGIDAVHGHTNLAGAVAFPHNIGLGAANNPDLIEEISRVTARELSVSGHDWTFAPTLAAPQDDRWGRTYEGFSEGPEIIASYADRVVYGLQGRVGEDDFMGVGRVIPSAKHFLGDGGTKDGVDQGDAQISEEELRDIHGTGYIPAVEAGAQTVMASFSAWQGVRMHGSKELLTDVLKGRMNFNGFIVGDWNGHALIPGCTATDCPDALNAGLDMYMAPDSWKGLWESTLRHVQSGEIPMERLDDAVRRILRVKIESGIFEKPKPSERPLAGNVELLGSEEHRSVARQAVRESLVLLKNNNKTLPLDPSTTVLVVGDGADSITKASGGWTLSWQGGGHSNDEFPNGQSILGGIVEAVEAAGGSVIFDEQADGNHAADVVIAVYGEDPYAEFQGDRSNVDFEPNGFDPTKLIAFQDAGTPVVSVFLSGRPLWVNPEINLSDAFIAAWLPGSEGGGIADMLFQTDENFTFTGRLSYSWPKLATQTKLNVHDEVYDPLFPVSFGLDYDTDSSLAQLSEESGLDGDQTIDKGVFFSKGAAPAPWGITVDQTAINGLPYTDENLTIMATDREAQEDSLRIQVSSNNSRFALTSSYDLDMSAELDRDLELSFYAKTPDGAADINVGMGCDGGNEQCDAFYPVTLSSNWTEYRLPMRCFADAGIQMEYLEDAFILGATEGQTVDLSEVKLSVAGETAATCPTE